MPSAFAVLEAFTAGVSLTIAFYNTLRILFILKNLNIEFELLPIIFLPFTRASKIKGKLSNEAKVCKSIWLLITNGR